MRHPERHLHRLVATYLRTVLTEASVFFHPPNGGLRSKAEGALLSGFGVLAGLPDLCVLHDGRAHWIELKAEKGRLSVAQSLCHKRLWSAGCPVVVARSLDDVQHALASWGIPTRDAGMRRAA